MVNLLLFFLILFSTSRWSLVLVLLLLLLLLLFCSSPCSMLRCCPSLCLFFSPSCTLVIPFFFIFFRPTFTFPRRCVSILPWKHRSFLSCSGATATATATAPAATTTTTTLFCRWRPRWSSFFFSTHTVVLRVFPHSSVVSSVSSRTKMMLTVVQQCSST